MIIIMYLKRILRYSIETNGIGGIKKMKMHLERLLMAMSNPLAMIKKCH